MSKSYILVLDEAQNASILAALRFYQQSGMNSAGQEIHEIASNAGAIEPLSSDEIDCLCESINQDALEKKSVIEALKSNGFEFSDFVSVYGERSDSNPYVKAAQDMVSTREGDLEVDEPAVVSAGEDFGAYVLAWLWVSNDEAGVYSPSDRLWDLYDLMAKNEDRTLRAYHTWLGETLDNFSDQLDGLETDEATVSAPTQINWNHDGVEYSFLPSEAIEALLGKAIEAGASDHLAEDISTFLSEYGDKLDSSLSSVTLNVKI